MIDGILKVTMALTFLISPVLLDAAKACECGTHADGITNYVVGDDSGCCTGKPLSSGVFRTYEIDKDGVYTVKDSERIEGTAAQSNCCPIT